MSITPEQAMARIRQLENQQIELDKEIAGHESQEKLLLEQQNSLLAEMQQYGVTDPAQLDAKIQETQAQLQMELDQIETILNEHEVAQTPVQGGQ